MTQLLSAASSNPSVTEYDTLIPELPETADIVEAFKLYHYGKSNFSTSDTPAPNSIYGHFQSLKSIFDNVQFSSELTGIPTAPTASVDTNTTQIATTAFVIGQASTISPLSNATVPQAGSSRRYSRQDHSHPTTGLGVTSGTLAQFATTTSDQFRGVISNETGVGSLVFATNPSLTNPTIAAATISGAFSSTATITGGIMNPTTLQQGGVAAVLVSGAQTLTEKTLTSPIISNASSITLSGDQAINSFRVRNIYGSTINPASGDGSNGDIWFVYT